MLLGIFDKLGGVPVDVWGAIGTIIAFLLGVVFKRFRDRND